ncbi:MAG: beta-galactosidase [Faecalibacterium sp.]
MSKFLFGAVYVLEQDYTDAEIRVDLQNMKDQGFNLITLWPIANPWLAKSSHEWVFTKTREVLDICSALEIQAILQLFGQNQAQEFMPDSASLPELELQDERPYETNHICFWANLNHPTVRDYMDKYFKECILALKDHPAIYGWDLFNEAHFRSDDAWTLRRYQDWLKARYGSIEKLNKEWYRRYESFYQVRPEKRRAPYSVWSSLLPATDYELFRSENVTEICQFLYDTAKQYDDAHPMIIDGTSSYILSGDLTMRNNDEFATAYVPDIYGATFYPKSWGRNYKKTPWTLSMYFTVPASAARKAGKPYLVNELQTHTQSVLTPGSEVTPFELVSWTLMCVFTGISGMQLWRWRPFLHGYQSTGRGLTRMDGTPNKRATAIGDMLRAMDKKGDLFANFAPVKPSVKILCSYESQLFFQSLLHWGETESFWDKEVEGWYKLFWSQGYAVEFADLDRFTPADFDAPVMLLPCALRITAAQSKALTDYVAQGGILIADARLGTMNEYATVPSEGIPGKALSDLFGVVEVDVTSGECMVLDGTILPTGFQSQQLEVTAAAADTAQVLATMQDGSPAIVRNQYGKGKTLYFNNFEGLALLDTLHPALLALIGQELAGLHCPRAMKHEAVHLAMVENETSMAMLLINFTDEAQTVQLTDLPAEKTMTEQYSGSSYTTAAAGEVTTLTLPATCHAIYTWDK